MTTEYDKELVEALVEYVREGLVSVGSDSKYYFAALAGRFPIEGSRIDWANVIDSVTAYCDSPDRQINEFISFFRSHIENFHSKGRVIYIGDGATDNALILDVVVDDKCLSEIFSIPQHHYFIAEDFSQCMVFSFEGDMGFGMSDGATVLGPAL